VNIKLDENLGSLRVATLLRLAGHDVATVREQGLISTHDEELIDICRSENRCLVTIDRGFGNRLKYKPSHYTGIIVIRLPPRPTFEDYRTVTETLIAGLEAADVTGKLWIIRQGSIQEYQDIEMERKDK
jgi:predicted nuclease of predicted toxin-antitoxin system